MPLISEIHSKVCGPALEMSNCNQHVNSQSQVKQVHEVLGNLPDQGTATNGQKRAQRGNSFSKFSHALQDC